MLGKHRDEQHDERDDKQMPRRTHAMLKCWNLTENELRKYVRAISRRLVQTFSTCLSILLQVFSRAVVPGCEGAQL
jgi:hypothetical protein